MQIITNRLIAEANTLSTPVEATSRLNKLSGQQMVEYALTDRRIDAGVFGAAAASNIEQARDSFQSGDIQGMERFMQQAIALEMSRSCPTGAGATEAESEALLAAGVSSEEDQYGSLTFTCPKGHSNTRPRGSLIPTCRTCGTSVACK